MKSLTTLVIAVLSLMLTTLMSCGDSSTGTEAESNPITVNMTYGAGTNQKTGDFFIRYIINNQGKLPIKVVSRTYALYGSAGAQLPDVSVVEDNLGGAWKNSDTFYKYTFDGYTASYIPYKFKFVIVYEDSQGKSTQITYTGDFKQNVDTNYKAINTTP